MTLWAALWPSLAGAAAYDVEARTEAQVYSTPRASDVSGQWRSLARRRLVQILDAAGFELVPGEDAGFSLELRFDADFGVSDAERAGLDDAYQDRLQLLTARIHWNGMANGRLDVELGRMLAQSPAALFAFDGARARVHLVRWLALAGFGGLRLERSSFLASTTFSPDGVRDSDLRRTRAGLPVVPCPSIPGRLCADPTLTDPAPTFGFQLAVAELPGASAGGAEIAYRRTLRAGAVIEERIDSGARWRSGPVDLEAASEYDLYLERLAVLRLGARVAALAGLALSAEGDRWQPSFSADSIFNLFDTAPYEEGRLRADLALPGAIWRAYASAGAQRFTPTDEGRARFGDTGGTGPSAALGGNATLGRFLVAADALYRGGVQGRQLWLTAAARRTFRGWLALDGRLSWARVEDPVTSINSGSYAAASLLVSGRLERRAAVSLLLEDATARFGGSDFRAYAFLTLGTDWDTRRP